MRAPLIVGGGPAGSAAAIRLAMAGLQPTLLERSREPEDKVCGDFLSGGSLAALRSLGLDPALLGGHPIHRVRLLQGERTAEAALPFAALGVSRRHLDAVLLEAAAQRGTLVRRGERLRGLSADGRVARLTSGESLAPRTLFLATGKHDVAGALRPDRAGGAVGLKAYVRLAPVQRAALAGSVEVVLLRGAYAGLQLVENDRAVVCVMQDRSAAPHRRSPADGAGPLASRDVAALLADLAARAPALARRLEGAVPERLRPFAIAGIPYGHLHRTDPADPTGLFRLGDQACVIPSLAGEGIALALGSGRLAAETWIGGGDAARYHHCFSRAVAPPLRRAVGLHRLCLGPAQAWVVSLAGWIPGLLPLAAAWTRATRLG